MSTGQSILPRLYDATLHHQRTYETNKRRILQEGRLKIADTYGRADSDGCFLGYGAPPKPSLALLKEAHALVASIDASEADTIARRLEVSDLSQVAGKSGLGERFLNACIAVAEVLDCPPEKLVRFRENCPPTLEAPRWFVQASNVARHPEYGTCATRETYGPSLFPTSGVALLVGEPKAGKTTWLIDRLSKWKSPDGYPLHCVFISLESAPTAMQGAASFELTYPEQSTVQVVPRTGFDLLDVNAIDVLASELKDPADCFVSAEYDALLDRVSFPDVLVLDSLSRSIEGYEENASATMSGVVAGLERLRRACNATLLIALHHTAKGGTSPRGHGSLLGGVDGVVRLSAKGHGDAGVVTVKCEASRTFEGGASYRYTRRAVTWHDLVHEDGDLTRIEFEEMPAVAPAVRAPARATPVPSTAPASASKPVQAPAHPAERLKGRAAASWALLALSTGQSMPLDDARTLCTPSACFADVAPGRVADRWRDVVAALEGKGLVDSVQGVVLNPS